MLSTLGKQKCNASGDLNGVEAVGRAAGQAGVELEDIQGAVPSVPNCVKRVRGPPEELHQDESHREAVGDHHKVLDAVVPLCEKREIKVCEKHY